jgi:hypothetical protein
VASAENLDENLRLQGRDPKSLPLVVQLNKRDLPNSATVEQLRLALDIPDTAHVVEAVATTGMGVYETLKDIVTQCLKRVGDPRALPGNKMESLFPRRRMPARSGIPAPMTAETKRTAVR